MDRRQLVPNVALSVLRGCDRVDAVVGEQVWNFADFTTTSGIMRVGGNKKGVFTRDRKPKMAAQMLQERWKRIPDFGYKH